MIIDPENGVIDMAGAARAAMAKLVVSGKIEQMIEAQLTKTIADLIGEQMRSYSDFGKALAGHIKQAIAFDPDRSSLTEYNATVAHIVNRKLSEQLALGAEHIGKVMDQILETPPAEIKLSQLVEDFKVWAVEDHRFERGQEHVTVKLEPKSQYGSRWLRMDPRATVRSEYDCMFTCLVTEAGTIGALRFEGRDPKKDVFLGGYYGFERTLFQLHARASKLVIDEFDASVPENAGYED